MDRYQHRTTAELRTWLGTDRETPGVRRELRRRGVVVNKPKPAPKWPTWRDMLGAR